MSEHPSVSAEDYIELVASVQDKLEPISMESIAEEFSTDSDGAGREAKLGTDAVRAMMADRLRHHHVATLANAYRLSEFRPGLFSTAVRRAMIAAAESCVDSEVPKVFFRPADGVRFYRWTPADPELVQGHLDSIDNGRVESDPLRCIWLNRQAIIQLRAELRRYQEIVGWIRCYADARKELNESDRDDQWGLLDLVVTHRSSIFSALTWDMDEQEVYPEFRDETGVEEGEQVE